MGLQILSHHRLVVDDGRITGVSLLLLGLVSFLLFSLIVVFLIFLIFVCRRLSPQAPDDLSDRITGHFDILYEALDDVPSQNEVYNCLSWPEDCL